MSDRPLSSERSAQLQENWGRQAEVILNNEKGLKQELGRIPSLSDLSEEKYAKLARSKYKTRRSLDLALTALDSYRMCPGLDDLYENCSFLQNILNGNIPIKQDIKSNAETSILNAINDPEAYAIELEQGMQYPEHPLPNRSTIVELARHVHNLVTPIIPFAHEHDAFMEEMTKKRLSYINLDGRTDAMGNQREPIYVLLKKLAIKATKDASEPFAPSVTALFSLAEDLKNRPEDFLYDGSTLTSRLEEKILELARNEVRCADKKSSTSLAETPENASGKITVGRFSLSKIFGKRQ